MVDRHKRSSYAIYHKSGFGSGSIQLKLHFTCFFAVSMWRTRMKLWAVLHGSFVILVVCSGEQSDAVDSTTEAGITSEEPNNPSIPFSCPFDEKNDRSCPFPLSLEESTCNWRQYDGQSPNFPNTGPPSGHEGFEDGYLLFESNLCDTANGVTTATITTKVLVPDSSKTQQCLQFWYFMYGGPNSLDVSVKFENDSLPTERKKFHRKGNQGRRWYPAHVTIDNADRKAYNLSFTAEARNSNAHAEMKLGDIAIDDVEFDDGGCNKTMDLCDFESGDLCGFKANPEDTGADSWWNLTQALDLDVTDHTFQTSEGHVASCELKSGKTSTARLVSKPVPITENKSPRITFWYQVGNLGQLGVRVKIEDSPTTELIDWAKETLVWYTNDSFSPFWDWNFASVAVPLSRADTTSQAIVFAFEASVNSSAQDGDGEGFVFMLDDIMVVMVDNADDPYNPPNCDFENGECGWTPVVPPYNVGNNWVHFRGKDNQGEYGPYVDHTLDSEEGHFMLFSSDYQSNAAAVHEGSLWSPRISRPIVSTVCFSFWHYTYIDRGANMDLTLTLHEPALDGSAGNRTLIQLTSPHQNRWTFVNVTVETVGDYQLVFNQTFYNASRGNVLALDDFQSKEGECHEHLDKFSCTADKQIDPWKVCDGRYDCDRTVSGSTTTDESMCGDFTSFFTNATVGDATFNFTETTGYIVTNTTSFQWQYLSHCDEKADADCHPAPDGHSNHTFSLGFFKADFAGSPNATSTYLHSPTINRLFSTTTMTFWYKIYSPNQQGALTVSLQMISTKTSIALLDVRSISEGSSATTWQQHNVTVGRMEGPLHFLFQARKAQSTDGYIAIDEILIEDRMFPVADPGNEKKCDNNPKLWHCNVTHVCIEQDKRCDFTDDCGEREDENEVECREKHPFRCSFDDNSLCSFWERHVDSDVRWIHTTTLTSTPYSGPLRDHTTGLKGGGYIHAPSKKGNVAKGHKAILSSPVLAAVAETDRCHMRFYYHMFGEDMGSLNVTSDTIRTTEDSPSMVIEHLFHAGGNHGDHWLRASVEFKSREPFRVVFTAVVGGVRSDLALDDISFSPNCKLYNPMTSSTVPSITVPSRQTVIPDATRSTSNNPATASPVTGADNLRPLRDPRP